MAEHGGLFMAIQKSNEIQVQPTKGELQNSLTARPIVAATPAAASNPIEIGAPKAAVSQIVAPAPASPVTLPPPRLIVSGISLSAAPQAWAPAWFYSALNWLGKAYTDSSNVTQSFGSYLMGSDVDPYYGLGSTQLFAIYAIRNTFRLSIAPDVNSSASSAPSSKTYPNTDDGIRQMYLDLSASLIFSSVKSCYIPGQLGNNFDASNPITLDTGYDPTTGLRSVVLGSAVSQVVPLADFLNTRNEQIYDDEPAIVPLVTSLVYDVTNYNALGETTFLLPVLYVRDQVTFQTYYVNRCGTTTTINKQTVNCGQTAVFPGGPGYNDSAAVSLNLVATAVYDQPPNNYTIYTYDAGKVITSATLPARVQAGVISLTYTGTTPAADFANQQIIGYFSGPTWKNCLGVPIYDYGTSNEVFANASAVALADPSSIYDPTDPFLNGGSLQNVVGNLTSATYLDSPTTLARMLNTATTAKDTTNGAGLSVCAAALDFAPSRTSPNAIATELSLPVAVTETTTPPAVAPPWHPLARILNRPSASSLVNSTARQVIGGGPPIVNQPGPVTIQVGLSASIPPEVLTGTGIVNIQNGTAFPIQQLGDGRAFEALVAGTVVNINAGQTPAFPPFDLTIASAAMVFMEGTYYVLSATGSNLTARGTDGSSQSSTLAGAPLPDANHTFVGAMVYDPSMKMVRLHAKLQLTLSAPAIGSHGVLQGNQYNIRLTYGGANSTYNITDVSNSVVDSNISIANPVPTDGSKPQQGDLYFGSFIGGANTMTLWSVPVFLELVPDQLTGASFNGTMTLAAQSSETPEYKLQITDSSLFVYSNFNVDTYTIGSVSLANVFLASAVINSAPDDETSSAFAPCKLLMGLVRQVQMGTAQRYVFVPEDDSVVIGNKRYMLSVINLDTPDSDPNSRPYPPVFWPQSRYWQFANRHNPYVDVEYTGATQADRISQAQGDIAQIGVQMQQAQEPMHMYLDTGSMTVWPIYAFPFSTTTQTVNQAQINAITQTILGLLQSASSTASVTFSPGQLDAEQITVPDVLQQNNPYLAGAMATVSPVPMSNILETTPVIKIAERPGLDVTNLSPNIIANRSIQGIVAQRSAQALQDQKTLAELAVTKNLNPGPDVVQSRIAGQVTTTYPAAKTQRQPIYGFSAYNPGTGEAYLVQIVDTDMAVPDQLPQPTENLTYDPYYVRVVFLNTMTCYNMSIIVPSMVHDQYGHLGQKGIEYNNVLSQTDELTLGYMYSLYDGNNNFDELKFSDAAVGGLAGSDAASQNYLYTNNPYVTSQTTQFNPASLFSGLSFPAVGLARLATFNPGGIIFRPFTTPPTYFVCRRKNWKADCHLMQATQPAGLSVFLAFGGGDIVPFRLDAEFRIDQRSPAHLYQFTTTFTDRQYESVKTISINNTPYVVGVANQSGVVQYMNFSINATAGTADIQMTGNQQLQFPTECCVVGQMSSTLTSTDDINTQLKIGLTDTGDFLNQDAQGAVIPQQFQLIPYNNLVYMIRAVSNVKALGVVGGLGVVSGLLVDTFVPSASGNLALAQAARYKRSGLPYFGSSYTPSTMIDTFDTLDFTSITGATFYAPTIFIPIPEIDTSKGFVADLTNFIGEQFWTLIYPEIVAQVGATVNGVNYANGFNLDGDGKSVLSLQKLQFVYDPLVVMYTPNDLAHKYPLQPKQQILALSNGQVQEGICWRTANGLPNRLPPANICAQQILPNGPNMDRANIIYSSHNRPIQTPAEDNYQGMSVNSFVSVSGAVYNIEESALGSDQVGTNYISQVSSIANMVIGVVFDYDNNDIGTLEPYDSGQSTRGIVFLNGYLGASGYVFSSPDHFDVNDILPSQLPLLDQVTSILGANWDVAFYNIDVSLPSQYWSLAYDNFTPPSLPNYITNVPPSKVDPSFTNRTRSLILSLQNPVRPTEIGLLDTYSSVVSANLLLQNGVIGSIFLNKKAERDIASLGMNPTGTSLNGLPTKYDFFLFSRDHYSTLKGYSFELIDQGYAMCLVDDSSGTGTKVAKFYVDADGNYNELYAYVLFSDENGILETGTFAVKVTLSAPANPGATPAIPETPNNVNPQDIVTQINKVSNLVYAAFGASSPGQAAAFIPIQAVGGGVQASPISSAPGFNGYNLNVMAANRQPVQISQIYAGNNSYLIAGSTTIIPINPKTGKAVPFYGSISHGLDQQTQAQLISADQTAFIPRATVPPGPQKGLFGGNGLGALTGQVLSCAFQGSAAIPPAIAAGPPPGTIMTADDSVFYTFNALNNMVMDSGGKSVTAAGGQYFVDATDPLNPIYGVVALPKFTLNGNTYTVNLSTTLPNGVTSRYSLIVGGKSYLFGPDNTQVTVDGTLFTFSSPVGGPYVVTYAAANAPTGNLAPTPITLTPFSITMGGVNIPVDVFKNPGGLNNIIPGTIGRQYAYNPILGTVTITSGAGNASVPILVGLVFSSNSNYGYVIGFGEGTFTINGSPAFQYNPSFGGAPASYPIVTQPKIFTLGGNFFVFNQDPTGAYTSVTGKGTTYPVNPYQFSINGEVYIINTNVQPNTVVGGGNSYPMTAGNTQFIINGVLYTITLKQNSLNGASIYGQFNVTEGNVIVIENYVYELDTENGQIIGNGMAYPLTTSGLTYTITTTDRSFTVTTEPNATTVTIGNIVYQINNTTVIGGGVTYPILPYRRFVDEAAIGGSATFTIGSDGIVAVESNIVLSGSAPFTKSTFTDSGATYTVNDIAAFDGKNYYLISGTPPQFTVGASTYTLRSDGVSVSAGSIKTYLLPSKANQVAFGSNTIFFGRTSDSAAFDGVNYYAIANNQFKDTTRNLTFTLSGNTAVCQGNSYEVYSNLGQGAYFQVLGGATYYINMLVADTGTASGDIYNVFPITNGQFTVPLKYTITIGPDGQTVSVASVTITGGSAVFASLTAANGALTGGSFQDPVTKISYNCVVQNGAASFIDSNNAIYQLSATGTFVASVIAVTGTILAVDNAATPNVYPVLNNQFTVGTTTYVVNTPVAYQNAAMGPYFPMVNGRFTVPQASPISNITYAVAGGTVLKGFVVSNDDEFSIEGKVFYTINDVNVVRAAKAKLGGTAASPTLTDGTLVYTLNSAGSLATMQPAGLNYSTASKQFSFNFNGIPVNYSYTAGTSSVTDNRHPANTFPATVAGTQVTFTDIVNKLTFTFDSSGSGNNPVTIGFVYTNGFFTDLITNVSYYIDTVDNLVQAISYLPETKQYSFVPADGRTYLIHYNDVGVVIPIVSGANVNAGVATVGSDIFQVHIDQVASADGATSLYTNPNSFELNGVLYSIKYIPVAGNPTDYSASLVTGGTMASKQFSSSNTFQLTDPNVLYTLQLDESNLPSAIVATYRVQPSRALLNVNDYVYVITYNTASTGSLLGQGQASIAITNSSFTLTNPFDSTKAKFIFADLDIYDAASVVGQFTAYLLPTFFMANATYTFDPVNLVVTDNSKRTLPLIPNPTMFSIGGVNYVIDTNQIPHAIVGNGEPSSLSTDVTVENGQPVADSTFTLNGQIYAYNEDAHGTLMTITGTKSYQINQPTPPSQPTPTFKLDSSLIFKININTAAPPGGSYAGTTAPIGTITAGTTVLNLYAGIPESGNADYFMYKNVMYTMVKSGAIYVAVQKAYTVYAAQPSDGQKQLAVFNLNGTTYLLTTGTTTTGVGASAGINPGTMWAQTSVTNVETQFGLVYGVIGQASMPITVVQSAKGVFQFQVTDSSGNNVLYDVLYTAGSNNNMVTVDVPTLLPGFVQSWTFTLQGSEYPLTFETGGYNAFTTAVAETAVPVQSFAGAYKTPVTSTDSLVDQIMTKQGDFSVEFWHSLPLFPVGPYHLFTFQASSQALPVYFVDVEFDNNPKVPPGSPQVPEIYLRINNTVMSATTTPPVFSSGWQHFALTYTQPYVMLCQGAGFEVKKAANYNFNRDFSIAITFSALDINTAQGLLYKGTGSDNTSPELDMSYRVGIKGGTITLDIKRADGTTDSFTGPPIQVKNFYQLLIIKTSDTPAGNDDSGDPYAPPINPSDIANASQSGTAFTLQGLNSGNVTLSGIGPNNSDPNNPPPANLVNFYSKFQSNSGETSYSYSVRIALRSVNDDGTYGDWQPNPMTAQSVSFSSSAGLVVNTTGSAHLLIGAAYDDVGTAMPFGGSQAGNIREVYVFNAAISADGTVKTATGPADFSLAMPADLVQAGLIGHWEAEYDPNGFVNNSIDDSAGAAPTNAALACLAPLSGHEFAGTTLYVNGVPMTLSLVTGTDIPATLPGYAAGAPLLELNAGVYKLEEISIWNMTRQPYQVLDDMFGRLVATNEPFLVVYLSGSPSISSSPAVLLPLSEYIDQINVKNQASLNLAFLPATIDLSGCPSVARCGPLIAPNLYTPPGVALTVSDTVPDLTTYSVTLNTVTGTLAGEVNELYVYIRNGVLTMFAGKKVGDLLLTWVSQEQGDPQLMGYIEGAPPCPMANLTNKASYAGATSVTFTALNSSSLKYQQSDDSSTESQVKFSETSGVAFSYSMHVDPVGFGPSWRKVLDFSTTFGGGFDNTTSNGNSWQYTDTGKIDESNKYTLKMEGTLSPYTNDLFMASLNSLTTPSTTPGTPSSKTPILPNPNLGGFTTSNPPSALPKTPPTEEKFGSRMYVPSPYGQAFVTSQTLDVYQQTLVQTNTVYGFVRIPNTQIPRDLNILSFRISSKYIRPGCLDGIVGYIYNPATLPSGTQTYGTSTGQMSALYDQNFSTGDIGNNAGYMRVVEAYQAKKAIDQKTYNAIALYQAAYGASADASDPTLRPALDFYNEYIWSSKGAIQEVKHTFSTTFDEVYSTTTITTNAGDNVFNIKLAVAVLTLANIQVTWTNTNKDTSKTSFTGTVTNSFDFTASFDGIETDTQMRYASANDAHFVMNNNSMFNPNNQSGLNLIIGSDGLVYNIVPSVASGAGLPVSDNKDTSQTYSQPQPSYTSGNADGLTGTLEPYDRPGKVNLFRTYAFFLQPVKQNADDFWNTVIDQKWLNNSSEPDAIALRPVQGQTSTPWRLYYRVTYCERFLPPISTAAVAVPQITPLMAVPVLNPPTDFLFATIGAGTRPKLNPANDIEANIVLAAPTSSGFSAGTTPTTGPGVGVPVLPNNVIPFDLVKNTTPIINWGDTANAKLLTQLLTSALKANIVPMASVAPPGSTKVTDVINPVGGGALYSVFTDPNGLTINVPVNSGIIVYQDVNGNPIQYFDGKTYQSLQADYVASSDGTIMYYIEPPATYDQTDFDLLGDYDLFGHPGDQWRYFLVSGQSSNLTSEATFDGAGPFFSSSGQGPSFTGFTIANSHLNNSKDQVAGYVLVQGVMQWPNLNTNAETFADVQIYKSMSLLDTFPIGDPEVLKAFLQAQYPDAPFVANDEINLVFAKNIISYFNASQQALMPQ